MELFFADDSRQNRPSRNGMGPLIATGGILVKGDKVRALEKEVDNLCTIDYDMPQEEEFKWSPDRGSWFRQNLVEENRTQFFIEVLSLFKSADAKAIVVIVDMEARTATDAPTHEQDVTSLLLERVDNQLARMRSEGIVIVDRPRGDRGDEYKFLAGCLETLRSGTDYVSYDHIALNVLSTPSRLIRLLQAADVVTSCTLSAIGGEDTYSPPVFHEIKDLLLKESGRYGGVGLKIHPDFKYANLYHWLLGDTHFWRYNCGNPLPLRAWPYNAGPDIY